MKKQSTQKIPKPRHRLLFSLITILFVLIVAELSLRLLGMFPAEKLFDKSTKSDSWQENLFAGFMGIHESDPELLWKMKPNLNKSFVSTNSRGLTGPNVPYKKDPSKFRIMLIGDSTPLGIGLADWGTSFIWLLGQFLSHRMEREVEIINASTAGYSSLQGLKYLQTEGLKYKPDLLMVYLGNNDASYNGYLSDADLMKEAGQFVGVKKILNKFRTYRLLKTFLLQFKGQKINEDNGLQVRVAPDNYRRNLQEIVALCQKNDIDLILNTVPVPLTWPPGIEFRVFASGRDTVSGTLFMPEYQRDMLTEKAALALDWEMFEQNYGEIDPWSKNVLRSAYTDTGDIQTNIENYYRQIVPEADNSIIDNNLGVLFWREANYDSALVYLRKSIEEDPFNPVFCYNMGMVFYKLDQSDSAQYYLELAKDNDFNSLRIKSEYNRIIAEIAREKNIPLVDLEGLFAHLDREKLFVDHCHPNQRGHRLIAEQFARLLETEIIRK